ncbi:MAG: folate-binding protein [Gammaproteobacteria bacterium]|nr:folate-binding protein [Gammaproteobacteria bacterium]
MRKDWQDLLRATGAHFQGSQVAHFNDPAGERQATATKDVICVLSHETLVTAHGPDAEHFLQAQLTNDVGEVSTKRSQLTAYLNPKGRMLGMFRLVQYGKDTFVLKTRLEIRDELLTRLQTYVLRSKVMLSAADDSMVALGVSGPGVARQLEQVFGVVPDATDACLTAGHLTLVRVRGATVPRFEILGCCENALDVWRRLADATQPVGASCWAWQDILAGIPCVLPQTIAEFVPQMANLDLLGGVSFQKGCFPGQEIVARLHYLGKLKQRMILARVESYSPVSAGAHIYSPVRANQSVGTVVDAQPGVEGDYDLLAVVQLSSYHTGELFLESLTGPRLVLRPLPYNWDHSC